MKEKLTIFVLSFSLLSCNVGPEQIEFGVDHCAYCRMKISDPRFGAEVVTQKGRIYKFDAIECLIPFVDEQREIYSHTLAIPFDQPGKLKEKDSLQFVFSPAIISPMGANIAAFSKDAIPSNFIESEELQRLNWEELKLLILEGY